MNKEYIEATDKANKEFYRNARDHGFWEEVEEMRLYIPGHLHARFEAMVIAEKIALMHSELSEALEAVRKDPNARDSHCPNFTNLEIELADLAIRRGDLIQYLRIQDGEAVQAKHEYNKSRPYRHGKKL